ncbi:glycosyl hydrolase family 28-related protein [Paenibacillus vini]|uniref:glycosyl hydrolase family 28-related protein n=1 Tax=Paenibacillus vini TaxID=1476024 RepID=UPI0025B6C08C|nr:glycosyl hydrolase family 28-related protein [Paenibacillus vini]MDN4069927.1 glycosyl hydrolase family 28-related protein [Paenibacillus vini]
MALSRYGGVTGTAHINEDFENINKAFNNVAAENDANKAVVDNHLTSNSAHTAAQITYGGGSVKDELDSQSDRIDNIVSQSGDDITEIVDARQPQSGSAYPTLKARLDSEHGDITAQLADLVLNVKSFGAKGDGETDDTQAFKDALTAAGLVGGKVYAPPSLKGYLINGNNIKLPPGTSLIGGGSGYNGVWEPLSKGTVLLITGGAGDENGDPVFVMRNGCEIKGLSFVYPNQTPTNQPIPYPWLISGESANGNDTIIEDIFLYNCYKFCDYSMIHERVTIRDIYGDVLKSGIVIDNSWDVDRLENIHFWPYFSNGKEESVRVELAKFRTSNCVGITLGQADAIQVNNIFCYGLYKGMTLGIGNRGPYGQMGNISFDICAIGIDAKVVGSQGIVLDNYSYAMNPGLQTTYGITESCAVNAAYNGGSIYLSNVIVWGGPNKFLITKTEFVNSNFVVSDINLQGNQDEHFVSHAGTGEVTIANLKTTLTKKLLTGMAGSSPITFENVRAPREYYDGPVIPIIKSFNSESVVNIEAAFTIYLGVARKALVTGSTTIENIVADAFPGTEIVLIFKSNVVVANGGGWNIRLASQFNATPNDTLTLIYDGANWLEKSRSANV